MDCASMSRSGGSFRRTLRGELTPFEKFVATRKHTTLTGRHWGVSRDQFVLFVDIVRGCLHDGSVINFQGTGCGPNMYLVTDAIIKPVTSGRLTHDQLPLVTLPGVSWALMCNEFGAACDLFVSHAWVEPVFEFAKLLLAAWPEEAMHAYICFLANPQNLDISELLQGPPRNSPFADALTGPEMKRVIMVGNTQCAIHSRLWCVYEAFLSHELEIHVQLAGKRTNFITSWRSFVLAWTLRVLAILVGFLLFLCGDTENTYGGDRAFDFIALFIWACYYDAFWWCCVSPLRWRELDPRKASCSDNQDRVNICREIEALPSGWNRLHLFVDELLHCNAGSTNQAYVLLNLLLYNRKLKYRIGYFLLLLMFGFLSGGLYLAGTSLTGADSVTTTTTSAWSAHSPSVISV